MFGNVLRESEELFLQTNTSQIDDSEPIEHHEIMTQDVNIEEKTKAKCQF